MTLRTTTISLAGLSLEGAFDGEEYYVCVPELEKALDIPRNTMRKKLASESLKSFAGKTLALGKRKRSDGGFVNCVTTKDFSILVGWQAMGGNKAAVSLLIALAAEAIERRIDSALGVVKSEGDYEKETRDFFRELARKTFLPELTSWWASSELAVNYGKEVNVFKSKLGLPRVNVDQFSREEMQRWAKGINSYNTLRTEGYGHKQAIDAVSRYAAIVG